MRREVVQVVDPATDIQMLFVCDTPMTFKRAANLYSKEPDTIEWLRSMETGDHLIDIGANVGMYSIFAAAVRGVVVTAFEPEALNFARLNENIFENWDEQIDVRPYPYAASDVTESGVLYVGRFVTGRSGHTVDRMPSSGHFDHQQGTHRIRLDEFCNFQGDEGQQYHVKIDTDGHELEVIDGMGEFILSINSLLVEIDTRDRRRVDGIVGRIIDAGLRQVSVQDRRTAGFQNRIYVR